MHNQNGNVLFLILIAVALFAALSYAVTSSNRSSGSNADNEKAQKAVAATLQYLSSMRVAIQRLKISNGCTDSTLDFSNNVYVIGGVPNNNPNPSAPSGNKCHIFHVNGGNITPVTPPIGIFTPDLAQESRYPLVELQQIDTVGTSNVSDPAAANDITITFYNINKTACLKFNEALGVANPGGAPPVFAHVGAHAGYSDNLGASTAYVTNPKNYAFCSYVGTLDMYTLIYALGRTLNLKRLPVAVKLATILKFYLASSGRKATNKPRPINTNA